MANKKINQLVSKTAILSTDIFGIGDATTGQLFKKTIAELQAAIGGAVISVNGLVGTVVLDTDDIQELATPTNKYFTDARARGAISLTVTGNSGASTYSSGTGVLNVPTYTLAGLGGITATFLSGTSGISYNSSTGVITYSGTVYTDASIRALFSGSTGITYNSSTGAISYSGTVYTDSSVRALISMTTTGNSGASTYNNTTGVINVPEYTLAGLGGISLTSLSGGTGITYNSSTGAISYSGTVYTDASVRALISASGSVSYNNTTGVISLTGGNLTEATSSVLTITGGTGAVIGGGTSIQVKQATTSVSGFLSSTDWTTFNNKQSTITLTTTGTSGNATFSSNTLNIPNYGSALSGYLPLTGGTLTGALGGTSASFSGDVAIGLTTASRRLHVKSGAGIAQFESNTTSGTIYFADSSTTTIDNQGIGTRGNNIAIMTGGIDRLTLASTGAATFSGDVLINCLVNSNQGNLVITSTNNDASGLSLKVRSSPSDPTNSRSWMLFSNYSAAGTFEILRSTTATGNPTTVALKFDGTGAATFSSSVTATSLGINVSSIYGKFEIAGSAGAYATAPAITFTDTAGTADSNRWIIGNIATDYGSFNISSAPTPSSTSWTPRITILKAGNVGIGSTTPSFKLETLGSSVIVAGFGRSDYGASNVMLIGMSGYRDVYKSAIGVVRTGDYDVGNMIFCLNSAANGTVVSASDERMRITSGGNILMGTSSDNGERLYVSGAIRATSTITANSDLTLKKNLIKIENALEKVEQINGYTYEFKADDSKRHAGVIAQEIQTVLPEIVNKGNDGILGVEYGNISALLIEAIKEQNIKIKNLETLLASK